MRFADLFCGIGGFRLALERAGAECVYANDNDKFACQIYRKHWDDGTLDERDIREVEELPEVDLVTGGFPCQDLSVAGKRAGLRGEKSGVFFEMVRLIEKAKPKAVLLENVPGLLSSGRGRDFFVVLDTLDQLGYSLAWRILNARYFGVPQRRRRVFIVGCARGRPDPAEVLFEREGCGGDSEAGRGEGEDVANPLETCVRNNPTDEETFVVDSNPMVSTPDKPTIVSSHRQDVAYPLRTNERNNSNPDCANYIVHENLGGSVTARRSARALRQGASHSYQFVTHALSAEGADASEDGTGRGTPLTVLPMGGGPEPNRSGMYLPDGEMAVRRLLPVECERLQGFPDGHTAWGLTEGKRIGQRLRRGDERRISDTQRYKALGNAVCVPVVEWIAQRLVAVAEGAAA